MIFYIFGQDPGLIAKVFFFYLTIQKGYEVVKRKKEEKTGEKTGQEMTGQEMARKEMTGQEMPRKEKKRKEKKRKEKKEKEEKTRQIYVFLRLFVFHCSIFFIFSKLS